MRVDGRDITVTGEPAATADPPNQRHRAPGAGRIVPAIVITSSLITRNDWVGLEKSVSGIVGVLTPTQSNWSTWPTASRLWHCRS